MEGLHYQVGQDLQVVGGGLQGQKYQHGEPVEEVMDGGPCKSPVEGNPEPAARLVNEQVGTSLGRSIYCEIATTWVIKVNHIPMSRHCHRSHVHVYVMGYPEAKIHLTVKRVQNLDKTLNPSHAPRRSYSASLHLYINKMGYRKAHLASREDQMSKHPG